MRSFLKNLSSRLSVILWSSPLGEIPKFEDRVPEDRVRSALRRARANLLAQRAGGARRACAKGWRRTAERGDQKKDPLQQPEAVGGG